MANTGVFGGPLNKLVPRVKSVPHCLAVPDTLPQILQGLHHLGKAKAKKVMKATGELSGYPVQPSFAHV